MRLVRVTAASVGDGENEEVDDSDENDPPGLLTTANEVGFIPDSS